MKLGTYFTLEELTHTDTGLENIPNAAQIENLKLLVKNILDPLRKMYGYPIIVNSGFRSKEVNKKVNGSSTSEHMKGMAADIKCGNSALLFKLIRDNFEFRQLIWEYGNNKQPSWVHVSFNKKDNKKQIIHL